jgi:rhamnulokinase/L-fuculokinase
MGNPIDHRDSRTLGMFEKMFSKVPKKEAFERIGIQFMELNTLYQMMALSLEESFQYRSADKMLIVPELVNYWLTGKRYAERALASVR